MKNSKRRIEAIDIAKAITILLVILGHTTGNTDTPLFRRMLYTFHMPLFFALAGISIKPKLLNSWKEWLSFLQKNVLALLVPYFIWGLVYAPFSYQNIQKLLYGSWEALGQMETLTSLWYLPCFFLARIFVQAVIQILGHCKVKNLPLWYGICAIGMFIVGTTLYHPENGWPWGVDIAFVGTAFILLGIALRKLFIIMSQQKTIWFFVSLIASTTLFCIGTIFRGDALELSLMCKGDYGNLAWFICNSISGSMIVVSLSMLISRISRESAHPFHTDAITYIGQHTMGIYLLHKPFLQQVTMPILLRICNNPDWFLPMAIIGSFITLGISILFCMVIERFIPQLLGQFTPNEWKQAEKAEILQ
jgi:fucose 4-O-acetylase-like acetyltransferase